KALERENLLKDETISQQQELALISQREKEWQQKELEKEKLLSISLSNENKLNEQLIEKDKNKKRNLLIGIGLLTLAGISILYLYRKQVVKNRIINKQREDLVMLNREIHHRVKNNLQIISSLLDLQSATINDEPTAEKFREGSQRVQSMAYIHQNLYQGESPGIVDMKEYISILADNLMQSFNTEGSNIQLQTSVDNVQLHSDMVISLGLIINELVSNAFKYAFQNKQAGQIDIVLKKEENHLLLQVKDNGVGMSKKPEPDKENSFGYKVIRAFTQKLKATISIQHKKGTDVRILIPHYRMA
ncbi:MAG: sensor histidine kinase, partial [Chitinophagaceae bacterium]|nr:sensor histidine kinase [Chitinophagaceae bacterium]